MSSSTASAPRSGSSPKPRLPEIPQSAVKLLWTIRRQRYSNLLAYRERLISAIKNIERQIKVKKTALKDEQLNTWQKSNIRAIIHDLTSKLDAERAHLEDTQSLIGYSRRSQYHMRDAEEELKRIASFHGVQSIEAVSGGSSCGYLSIIVRVLIPYRGRLYDIGDFDIRIIQQDSPYLGIYCGLVRKASERNLYLFGSYANGVRAFCLGTRNETITAHLNRGEYASAVELTIATIHVVNNGDESAIPVTFKEWKEE